MARQEYLTVERGTFRVLEALRLTCGLSICWMAFTKLDRSDKDEYKLSVNTLKQTACLALTSELS
jgi:hypothetical protein